MAFERRITADLFGRDVSVITAEDLVISKMLWAAESRSEKQMTDVKNLMRNELDLDYIKSWTTRLNIDAFFEEMRKETDL